MSRSQQVCLASLCVLMAGVHMVAPKSAAADDPDSIVFHDDYNDAIQEARLTKKPVFLEFRCAP